MSESHDIEQIARAIYESRNGAGAKPWSLRPNAHKAPYLDDARAILPLIRAAEERGAEDMRERAAEWHDAEASTAAEYRKTHLDRHEDYNSWRQYKNREDAHRTYADRLRALPPIKEGMSEWRDISTAPKTEDSVILAWDEHGGVYMAEWRSDRGRWQVYLDGQGASPTHWQPLPLPPIKEG